MLRASGHPYSLPGPPGAATPCGVAAQPHRRLSPKREPMADDRSESCQRSGERPPGIGSGKRLGCPLAAGIFAPDQEGVRRSIRRSIPQDVRRRMARKDRGPQGSSEMGRLHRQYLLSDTLSCRDRRKSSHPAHCAPSAWPPLSLSRPYGRRIRECRPSAKLARAEAATPGTEAKGRSP